MTKNREGGNTLWRDCACFVKYRRIDLNGDMNETLRKSLLRQYRKGEEAVGSGSDTGSRKLTSSRGAGW